MLSPNPGHSQVKESERRETSRTNRKCLSFTFKVKVQFSFLFFTKSQKKLLRQKQNKICSFKQEVGPAQQKINELSHGKATRASKFHFFPAPFGVHERWRKKKKLQCRRNYRDVMQYIDMALEIKT